MCSPVITDVVTCHQQPRIAGCAHHGRCGLGGVGLGLGEIRDDEDHEACAAITDPVITDGDHGPCGQALYVKPGGRR